MAYCDNKMQRFARRFLRFKDSSCIFPHRFLIDQITINQQTHSKYPSSLFWFYGCQTYYFVSNSSSRPLFLVNVSCSILHYDHQLVSSYVRLFVGAEVVSSGLFTGNNCLLRLNSLSYGP